MNRAEFLNSINDFDDLRDFCTDNGYLEDEVCDLVSEYELDEYVGYDLQDFDDTWEAMRDALNGIATGYAWYMRMGQFDYSPLDSYDFERMKERLFDELENDDFFDSGEEDDEEEDIVEEVDVGTEQEPEPEMEAVDIDGLDSLCNLSVIAMMENRSTVQEINTDEENNSKNDESEEELVSTLKLDEILSF